MEKYNCIITIQLYNGRKETHETTVTAENRTEAKTMAFEYFMMLADEIVAAQLPEKPEPPIFIGSEVELQPGATHEAGQRKTPCNLA